MTCRCVSYYLFHGIFFYCNYLYCTTSTTLSDLFADYQVRCVNTIHVPVPDSHLLRYKSIQPGLLSFMSCIFKNASSIQYRCLCTCTLQLLVQSQVLHKCTCTHRLQALEKRQKSNYRMTSTALYKYKGYFSQNSTRTSIPVLYESLHSSY